MIWSRKVSSALLIMITMIKGITIMKMKRLPMMAMIMTMAAPLVHNESICTGKFSL